MTTTMCSMRAGRWIITISIVCAGALAGCPQPEPEQPTTAPTTKTTPATIPATQAIKPPLTSLFDVIRAHNPEFSTTQPRSIPVDNSIAAHHVIQEPIYLDARGDLWITSKDSLPAEQLMLSAFKEQTHVTTDRLRFVRWFRSDDARLRNPIANLVVERNGREYFLGVLERYARPADPIELDSHLKRDWSRAWIWNDAIVVPTDRGISVIEITRKSDLEIAIDERTIDLIEPMPGSEIHVTLAPGGLIAWGSHADSDRTSRVAKFENDRWVIIAGDNLEQRGTWPVSVDQILPMLDGTVIVVYRLENELCVTSVLLAKIDVDERAIVKLVGQLSDPDPSARDLAQQQISAFGPGAWPVLERMMESQPMEARVRLRILLGDRRAPTIGGLRIEPGEGRIVSRLSDGGVVLYLKSGVSGVTRAGVTQRYAPVWLAVRPGRIPERLDGAFIEQLARSTRLKCWGDEWIIEHDVEGPLRWMGNHFEPIVRRNERSFGRFVGIDSRGRWILRSVEPDGPTLLIDPTIPDPRPRLPIWALDVSPGMSGWNDEGWPVIDRGGAWTLKGESWRALSKAESEKSITTVLEKSPGAPNAPILTRANGDEIFDGLTRLVLKSKTGNSIDWPLPIELNGSGIDGRALLFETPGEHRLMLVNAPGRIIRLKLNDDKSGFEVEAIFAKHIPSGEIRRIWQDPAGRIIIASGKGKLTICFPDGDIPRATRNLIASGELKDASLDDQ